MKINEIKTLVPTLKIVEILFSFQACKNKIKKDNDTKWCSEITCQNVPCCPSEFRLR